MTLANKWRDKKLKAEKLQIDLDLNYKAHQLEYDLAFKALEEKFKNKKAKLAARMWPKVRASEKITQEALAIMNTIGTLDMSIAGSIMMQGFKTEFTEQSITSAPPVPEVE